MDFRDSAEEAGFRSRLRAWLGENVPKATPGQPGPGRLPHEAALAWSRAVHEAGYVGLTWPKEYGGRGLPPTYLAIFLEEVARAGAPDHIGVIGLNMAGPTIMTWGSDEQKKRFLPRILSTEEIWCQGFSEPGSGSDLASVRTTATLEGDEWVVSGQKVWSSYAHVADWCLLLARSEPVGSVARRHDGLSYLLLDMRSPGVEVRPLRQITGDPEFNEIFLDRVRIPRESMLGEPGQGWRVAMTTLLHERGTLGFALAASLDRQLTRLITFAKQTLPDGSRPADDPLVRDEIVQAWTELEALRFTNYRALTALMRTGAPGPEGSIAKLIWSEAHQRLTKLAVSLQGLAGQLSGDGAVWDGYWQYHQLRSRGNTIEAGTSEILRNIIAERVLGLPRSR